MGVAITQDEINMLAALTTNVQNLNNSFQAALKARHSGIVLLEKKYNARFNEQTGEFVAES